MIQNTASAAPAASRARRPSLRALRDEIDELFSRFLHGAEDAYFVGRLHPAYDLYETDESLELRVDLPGMKAESIELRIGDDLLTIRGERCETVDKERITHHQERRMGKFMRTIPLPCSVEEEKASAEFRDGVMFVLLPKSQKAIGRKIVVKA